MSFSKPNPIKAKAIVWSIFLLTGLLVALNSCTERSKTRQRFTFLTPEQTGVDFVNQISATDSLNILNYIYFYDGGGVGVVDVNNDGLEDIFFTGNQVSNRLYLNRGDFSFQDITESAGLGSEKWCTGVSIADINSDGYRDIYVCVTGLNEEDRGNLLYINQGDNTFIESASGFGVADNGFSTQAAFLDYDRDGDLDLYVMNHANNRESLNTPLPKRVYGEAPNSDRLYRNNGNDSFTDVSAETGILIEGYGLGIAVSDINRDGWSDVYISNDFISNDLLYINNGNGTFTNRIADLIQEQTYNGMGADISDFNNDGMADILVLDMLSPDVVRAKTMVGSMTYEKFNAIIRAGYEPQYMRNTLQINRGDKGFDEIGRFAGIHRTDWSWAALFMDLDNDGWKDIFITNGYLKDITNKDFIDYNNNLSMFKSEKDVMEETLSRIEELNGVKLANYAFKNQANMKFRDVTHDWAFNVPSFSNGAAYADLDLDGDLDLVVSNLDEPAFIIRNNTDSTENYLQINLFGPGSNRSAIGAKVDLYAEGIHQFSEKYLSRGYMSTVTDRMHFGLGDSGMVDSIRITWPDGKYTRFVGLEVNQTLKVSYDEDAEEFAGKPPDQSPVLKESDNDYGIVYIHQQYDYNDFKDGPLLPHKLSVNGPILAAGDLNGDGLDDLFTGGSKGFPAYVFYQNDQGRFDKMELKELRESEVQDALIFDANGDEINDLYVACGSVRPDPKASRDKLFLGRKDQLLEYDPGHGHREVNTSAVDAADFDGDGDPDLFAGGFVIPGNYPLASQSYLLLNEGGNFIASTPDELADIGMVRDAKWIDYNKDDYPELMVVGEWMNIMLFKNIAGKLQNVTEDVGLGDMKGWWNAIYANDFDKDGDIDIICGNTGLNSPFSASAVEPMKAYITDFDRDGNYEPLVTNFVNGTESLLISREEFLAENPYFRRLFPSHQSFAEVRITDIFSGEEMLETKMLVCNTFESVYLENIDGDHFKVVALPSEVQLSPVYDMLHTSEGIIAVGNFDYATRLGESYGSGRGVLMKVDHGAGGETSFQTRYLDITGNARSIVQLDRRNGDRLIVVGVNSEKLKIYEF